MRSARKTAEAPRRHAVVIGASMAGLLAARALADAYERVTIVERDALPASGQRRAVPQGAHAHVLLASGRLAMEDLLPGITDELVAAGAQSCKAMSEIRFVVGGHEITREAEGGDVLLASRPLIEAHVRRRVRALPRVALRERCEVTELVASPDGPRMRGVRVRDHGNGAGGEDALDADLVVAASGRAGRVPALLEHLGLARPDEDSLRVDLRYVSRRVRPEAGSLDGDKLIAIGARPGLPRGMFLIAQEDHWILTLNGYGARHRPPVDEAGFLEFARSVAPPQVRDAVEAAEPLTEIANHGFPGSRRRRYERLEDLPDGLLTVGDALCSFNPLYGQGMSVAALEAVALRRCLERRAGDLGRRFLRAAAKVVDPAWDMAIGGDLALPEVEGDRPLGVRLSNAYVERLLRVAERDPVVATAFGDVSDLLKPPTHVMAPRILWRVLRGNVRRGRARAAAA
jgi:2-polyprenyl-6-methoxyphenol hydroxylase-like FAD-dependent oxidoreductase